VKELIYLNKNKMRKLLCLLSFVFCLLSSTFAQNLIPNYSFEYDTTCAAESSIFYAPPWFQPLDGISHNTSYSSSTDLFDTCANFSTVGVPRNEVGHQYGRTGVAYAGIFGHCDTINYREYLEVPLLSNLIAGTTYCVEFYVSLADTSREAISNIGAYFSHDSLLYNNIHAMAIDTVTPQIENPTSNMLSDKDNWMQVTGSFIAAGGERFMTIGNFHKPVNTNSINVTATSSAGYPYPFAYYYVDDVDVHCCSTDCGVGVNELGIKNEELGIWPNPCVDKLTVNSGQLKVKEIRVYDVMGEMVNDKWLMVNGGSATIDMSGFAKGMYFVEVKTEKGVVRKKVVKE
jgi:hypothetical protein